MSAKFPRGGGGAGPFLARSLGTQYATFSVLRLWEQIKQLRYTMCYLSSIKIMGAYSVGWVHNMLPYQYKDNVSILCRLGSQHATLAVLR